MDRRTSNAIKGIALILMFIHHFFTFPDWYIGAISYPSLLPFLNKLCYLTKICVPVFSFLTGYFYCFAKEKTYLYSLKKITDIYLSYWAFFVPFLIIAIIAGCYRFDIVNILLEAFAIKQDIMIFCWYVTFYSGAMLILPILTQMESKEPIKEAFLLLLLPILICTGISSFYRNPVIDNFCTWFPCIATGYLSAKYNLFCFFDKKLRCIKFRVARGFACILLVFLAFFGRYVFRKIQLGAIVLFETAYPLSFTMDFFFSPLFVYGLAKTLQIIKKSVLMSITEEIGKKSLGMWFAHCLFFNVCKEWSQKILYFPRNAVLVLIFGLALCYVLSILVELCTKRLLKEKNKLIDSARKKLQRKKAL